MVESVELKRVAEEQTFGILCQTTPPLDFTIRRRRLCAMPRERRLWEPRRSVHHGSWQARQRAEGPQPNEIPCSKVERPSSLASRHAPPII